MAKFRAYSIQGDTEHGFHFWCPGCDGAHGIRTVAPTNRGPCPWTPDGHWPIWTVSGGLDDLTASPSLLVGGNDPRFRCHSFVVGGRIQLLDDSTAHQLRGWQDIPEWGS